MSMLNRKSAFLSSDPPGLPSTALVTHDFLLSVRILSSWRSTLWQICIPGTAALFHNVLHHGTIAQHSHSSMIISEDERDSLLNIAVAGVI